MSLIGLLILLIVFLVIIWAVFKLIAAFSIPEPLATVIYVFVVLIAIFALLDQVGVIGSGPIIHLR